MSYRYGPDRYKDGSLVNHWVEPTAPEAEMVEQVARTTTKLPARRKRVRSGIRRGPKRMWLRHRKFVRSHCCAVPGCIASTVDCAHLRSVANGAGTSLKPHDQFTVPLCRTHHQQEEDAGPDAFGDRHGIDLWEMAATLVLRSPDRAMRESLREGG